MTEKSNENTTTGTYTGVGMVRRTGTDYRCDACEANSVPHKLVYAIRCSTGAANKELQLCRNHLYRRLLAVLLKAYTEDKASGAFTAPLVKVD